MQKQPINSKVLVGGQFARIVQSEKYILIKLKI